MNELSIGKRTHVVTALAVAAIFAAVGCGKSESSTGSTTTPAPAPTGAATATPPSGGADAEAQTYYKANCVVCHGANGQGDGPGASALDPKPQDFGNAAWQTATDDATLSKAILQGGAAVGKSPMMPAQPALQSKPEVLAALVKIIRGFKK